MALIFAGVFLVGLAALVWGDKDGDSTKALGLILLIIAQLFAGSLLIVEEKLLGSYYLDPLKVVGLEGMWGLLSSYSSKAIKSGFQPLRSPSPTY